MSKAVKMDLFLARCKLCGNTIDCYCAKALMHNRFRMRHKGGNMSKIIDFALAQVGKPYVFGRSGPDSFDCSGLTKRAAAQIGLDLYHGATTQYNRGTATGPPERYGYFDQTGPIETLPTNRVAFLFNQDKTAAKLTMAPIELFARNSKEFSL